MWMNKMLGLWRYFPTSNLQCEH